MKELNVFEHHRYTTIRGSYQNELIQKIQRMSTFSMETIEEALQLIDPLVEYSMEYKELIRLNWAFCATLFDRMETLHKSKAAKAITPIN